MALVVDKAALGQVYPRQCHSTGAQLHGKTTKIVIFVTGLYNKPQGCGASVTYAAGPFTKSSERIPHTYYVLNLNVNICYLLPLSKL